MITGIIADATQKSNVTPSSSPGYSGTVFEMPTATGVPVKADAGILQDTVSGAVKVVATETQVLPFQYSMMLKLLKLGFEIVMVAETPEVKAPLLEVI